MLKAFVTAQLTQEGIDILSKRLDLRFGGWGATGVKLTETELVEQARECEILIICYEPISDYVIENLPKLKLIACSRGGAENIPPEVIKRHPEVFITNAPGRNANAVADLAMGLMLSVTRQIPQTYHYIMSGQWDRVPWDISGKTKKKTFSGYELAGKTLGLVGYGAIARIVAKRALAFDMDVITYDPYIQETGSDVVRLVSREQLLAQSDFISLHCKLTKDSERLVDADFLAAMKPTAYLINTARGKLVDENALYEALRDHRILGAALDAMINEPLNHDHPFLTLDNIIMTPHIGGASYDIPRQQTKILLDDVLNYLETGRPVHVLS